MSTTRTLKKIDVVSVGKIVFFVDLILMAFIAVPTALIFLVVPHQDEKTPPALFFLVMMVVHPFLAAFMSALGTGVFNIISAKTGGIKFEIE
jgi:hypothetical protein